jgi:twitching motility protein PilT
MTAAETGHLIISTLHTVGAAKTIDRIVDAFPHEQQNQIRTQLAMLLRTVVSQQLLIKKDGGLTPAFEIMHVNKPIRKLILESKTQQIESEIITGAPSGMITMDSYIMSLVQKGEISQDVALANAANPEQMSNLFESRYFGGGDKPRVSSNTDWY